jgi:hypothetical protein
MVTRARNNANKQTHLKVRIFAILTRTLIQKFTELFYKKMIYKIVYLKKYYKTEIKMKIKTIENFYYYRRAEGHEYPDLYMLSDNYYQQ